MDLSKLPIITRLGFDLSLLCRRLIKRKGLRILTYHRVITPPPDAISVTPDQFREQLSYLKKISPVIDPFELETIVKTNFFSRPSMLITFDDGCEDNFNIAYPILTEYNFKALFFVSPNKIGTQGYMTWDMLKELSRQGMMIGSHGFNHYDLSKLDSKHQQMEIIRSKEIIEEKLSLPCTCIAYPYGAYNDETLVISEKHYALGFSCRVGLNTGKEPPMLLKRTMVSVHDYRKGFAMRTNGVYDDKNIIMGLRRLKNEFFLKKR